jgi:argininosuccinate synthase
MDANIMHISYESGMLENPETPPSDSMFQMTKNIDQWPEEPDEITIEFKAGVPVKVTNEKTKEVMSGSLEMFKYLNKVGGDHGIGRIDIVEDRFIGLKSRGVYESPGATIVYEAIRDLEFLVLDRVSNRHFVNINLN